MSCFRCPDDGGNSGPLGTSKDTCIAVKICSLLETRNPVESSQSIFLAGTVETTV